MSVRGSYRRWSFRLLPACGTHWREAAGCLSKLENRKSDGAAISTFAFTRDANGNITESVRETTTCAAKVTSGWYQTNAHAIGATRCYCKTSGYTIWRRPLRVIGAPRYTICPIRRARPSTGFGATATGLAIGASSHGKRWRQNVSLYRRRSYAYRLGIVVEPSGGSLLSAALSALRHWTYSVRHSTLPLCPLVSPPCSPCRTLPKVLEPSGGSALVPVLPRGDRIWDAAASTR